MRPPATDEQPLHAAASASATPTATRSLQQQIMASSSVLELLEQMQNWQQRSYRKGRHCSKQPSKQVPPMPMEPLTLGICSKCCHIHRHIKFNTMCLQIISREVRTGSHEHGVLHPSRSSTIISCFCPSVFQKPARHDAVHVRLCHRPASKYSQKKLWHRVNAAMSISLKLVTYDHVWHAVGSVHTPTAAGS